VRGREAKKTLILKEGKKRANRWAKEWGKKREKRSKGEKGVNLGQKNGWKGN